MHELNWTPIDEMLETRIKWKSLYFVVIHDVFIRKVIIFFLTLVKLTRTPISYTIAQIKFHRKSNLKSPAN